jgi:hypothetical protein
VKPVRVCLLLAFTAPLAAQRRREQKLVKASKATSACRHPGGAGQVRCG